MVVIELAANSVPHHATMHESHDAQENGSKAS